MILSQGPEPDTVDYAEGTSRQRWEHNRGGGGAGVGAGAGSGAEAEGEIFMLFLNVLDLTRYYSIIKSEYFAPSSYGFVVAYQLLLTYFFILFQSL